MTRRGKWGWIGLLAAAVAAGAAVRWLGPSRRPVSPPPQPRFGRFLAGPANNAIYPWAEGGGSGFTYNPHGNMAVSPSYGHRFLYGVTNSGRIFSLALKNGALRWQRQVGQTVMTQPLLGPGALYIGLGNRIGFWNAQRGHILQGTGLGGVMALSRKSGRMLWFHRTVGGIMPTGVLAGGTLYMVGGNRELLALDPQNGRVRWRLPLPGFASMSSPVLAGQMLVFGVVGDPYRVIGVNLQTHRLAFATPVPAVVGGLGDSSPASDGQRVFLNAVTSPSYRISRKVLSPPGGTPVTSVLYAVSPRTGRMVWQTNLGSGGLPVNRVAGIPTVAGRRVFLVSPVTGSLYALSARTGKRLWQRPVSANGKGSPLIVGNRVYVGNRAGGLTVLSARSGRLLGRICGQVPLGPSGPVDAGGSFYLPGKTVLEKLQLMSYCP